MSQTIDQATMYVSNWIMKHRDNENIKQKMDVLKVMDEKERMDDNRFLEITSLIKNSFTHGNMIQRNIFCFMERDEFKKVVSDRIAEIDDIYEMSKNFADLLENVKFSI